MCGGLSEGLSGGHMQRMKWCARRLGILIGAAIMGAVLAAVAAAASKSATESVRGTIDEVVRILKDQEMKKPDKQEERRRILEKVIADRFSWDEMAKRTLGTQWAKLDEKQREEFTDLFRTLLTNTYLGRIESYSGEKVLYLNERLQDGFAEVRTKVASAKTEYPMDYRLINKSGDWHVYDIVLDGVSLVNNYRGQFAKIIRTSSYEDLVEKLRNKSDKIASP
jgi:phospholipid transport system substrate-binding protein